LEKEGLGIKRKIGREIERIGERGILMPFQAIMTGDWHISNSLPYAKKDPKTLISDRLEDLVAVVDWIFNLAREKQVPVFILGDLFDQKRPDSVSLKTVLYLLRSACESGIEVYILPGNHEAPNERGLHYVVDALAESGIQGLTILEASHVLAWDGVNICPVPYRSRDETLELIQSYRAIQDPKVLLLHDSVIGVKNRGWVADEGIPVEELLDFTIVFSGHIHEKQCVWYEYSDNGSKKCKTAVIYPGAPIQFDFGDVELSPAVSLLTIRGPKSVEISDLEIPWKLSQHFFQETWVAGNRTQKGSFGEMRYIRMIFQGTDFELASVFPQLNSRMDEWKARPETRSVNFIHRRTSDKEETRLEVDTISGLPPMENLLTQFVDLFERGDRSALIQAGLEALRNDSETL
jgi:DNA repair exonuclease SbcCD nuclease subunit